MGQCKFKNGKMKELKDEGKPRLFINLYREDS